MNFQVPLAAHAVRAGGVIAYPTEAVWGLGCDPFDSYAVAKLLKLKARPVGKGLILIAGDWRQLAWLLDDLPETQQKTLQVSWPGPNTWLVPHRDRVPSWLHGDFDTIAVRIPAHPVVRQLCGVLGGPLVSTSANVAGARAATTVFQVRRYFGSSLSYVLPGRLGDSKSPSVIRDLNSGSVIRSA